MVERCRIDEHASVLEDSPIDQAMTGSTMRLSGRERDVLALAARGLTNGQIAAQLSLSIHGVKFHLASVFRKLGVDNRTAAAALYLSESPGQAQ